MIRRPGEMRLQIVSHCRTPAGVLWIQQEVLHVHRDKFLWIMEFVTVGATQLLMISCLALAARAHPLRPAGQIQQARVVAEGKAPLGLSAAFSGHADVALNLLARITVALQLPLIIRSKAATVVD